MIGFERMPQSVAIGADQVSSHARSNEHSRVVVSSIRRDDLLADWSSSRLSDNPSNIDTVLETHFLDGTADYTVSELDTAFANFENSGAAVAASGIH
jgi:hypothetical protein